MVAHEDHGAPLVTVHLMFHAGSRHEAPGRTGLAHLLEHLFFEGSQHAPKGHFDDVLERAGGTNNGSTWLDRTNYYETVPTHAVELPLWLERDRMAFFLPVLTDEILELQRGVVMNERKQAYENRPYGLADERLHEMLFPEDHPYSLAHHRLHAGPGADHAGGCAGILSDVLRARQRGPRLRGRPGAGAGLRPGGAVLRRPAGRPRAGAPPRRARAAPAPRVPRETMEDDVSFPRVFQAFAVPGYGHDDWVPLDVLAYLLADGDSSRLQRALVRDGRLAQDADTYLYPTALCGLFGLVATARSEVEPEALEETIRRVLDDVARDGVTDDEVTGAVRRARRDHASEMAMVEERADALAYAATVLGDADALNRVMAAYERVTPDDVRRVAAQYVTADRSATLVVVPGAESDEEGDDEEVADAA